MYDLILQLSLVISLFVMIYLLARSVPRVKDEELTVPNHNYFDQIIAKIPISKIDIWFNMFMAKLLRRLRIIVLKLDNLLHRQIISAHQNGNHQINNSNLAEDLNKQDSEI
ncbi:MAG: hypothetical protein AAB847_01730 [Patescibacteria group bacterium]